MLTKKDFVKAAEYIKLLHVNDNPTKEDVQIVCVKLVKYLADNPNFDESRFLIACGLTDENS